MENHRRPRAAVSPASSTFGRRDNDKLRLVLDVELDGLAQQILISLRDNCPSSRSRARTRNTRSSVVVNGHLVQLGLSRRPADVKRARTGLVGRHAHLRSLRELDVAAAAARCLSQLQLGNTGNAGHIFFAMQADLLPIQIRLCQFASLPVW